MVKFKATDEQIKHLQAVATNASRPVGIVALNYGVQKIDPMGFLHATNKVFTAEDFKDSVVQYGTDCVQGRMVKCYPREVGDGYELEDPRPDYQSWANQYPTAKALIEAAGLTAEE